VTNIGVHLSANIRILADFVVLAGSWLCWDQRMLDYRGGENYLHLAVSGTPYVIFEVIAALKVSSSLSVHR
jgi:hypothetical protein